MPSQYLDEFIRELRRDGDATFRQNHDAPVLIVTEAAGEEPSEPGAPTVMADTSGWRIQQVSLLHRVFAIGRGAFEKPGPIQLGRTESCDISIPDDSVSKRHCLFEVTQVGGATVMDCGSTNGTSVDGVALAPNEPRALRGGEKLVMGNFSFLFHTPAGFIDHLKRVEKA
jgi:hypothetical protein